MTRSKIQRYINIVERRIPSAPPTIRCRDDSGINAFDIAMTNVSIELSHELMVEILIRNFRVR